MGRSATAKERERERERAEYINLAQGTKVTSCERSIRVSGSTENV